MKGPYRSRSRLVVDVLAAIQTEGPVGVTRLLAVANMTHARLQDVLASCEQKEWVRPERDGERTQWRITEEGSRVLADLRRIDAAMQDLGLGL